MIEEEGISLLDIFRFIVRNILVISLTTILIFSLGASYTLLKKPYYESSAKVVLVTDNGLSSTSDLDMMIRLADTISGWLTDYWVLNAVIEKLDLDEDEDSLSAKITAKPISNSIFISVSCVDKDAEFAKSLCEAIITESLILWNEQSSIVGIGLQDSYALLTDSTPAKVISVNKPLYLLVSLAIGMTFGLVVACFKEFVLEAQLKGKEKEYQLSLEDFNVNIEQ